MKRKFPWRALCTALAVVLMVAGVALALFPKFSDMHYQRQVQAAQKTFTAQTAQTDYDRLYRELQRRNAELYATGQSALKDPFSYSVADIDLAEYGIKDNTIGYLSVPRLGVTLPILLGANSDNLLQGAVHLTQTSYPIGGNNTNSVIAAHRGWNRAQMFRHIEKLQVGDPVYVQNFRETLTYTVSEIEIIYPNEVDKLHIRPGQDMLTLITCHPYRVNDRRYVVYCTRSEN